MCALTPKLREALWSAVAFVAIAITVAAGIRLVDWIVAGGDSEFVWKTALVFIGAAAAGGKAVVEMRNGK